MQFSKSAWYNQPHLVSIRSWAPRCDPFSGGVKLYGGNTALAQSTWHLGPATKCPRVKGRRMLQERSAAAEKCLDELLQSKATRHQCKSRKSVLRSMIFESAALKNWVGLSEVNAPQDFKVRHYVAPCCLQVTWKCGGWDQIKGSKPWLMFVFCM